MKTKTTFAHSTALGRALESAALSDGRTVSCFIRRMLEKELKVASDPEAFTSSKTRKLL